jgi:uncharacterized protein (DUF1697 family)
MRYAAFLRAVNVGRTNRVQMADLRELCLGLGFERVATYLQSGNLVFDAGEEEHAVAAKLEAGLARAGLKRTHPVVRARDELRELTGSRPFSGYEGPESRQFVTLFREPLPDGAATFVSGHGFEVTVVRQREVFWVAEAGRERGVDVNGILERKLRMPGTTRYWHVVEAVAAL